MATNSQDSNTRAVWIATMPRSGSMWVYNVTRALFKSISIDVVPERIPQTNQEMVRFANSCISSPDLTKIAVVKIHGRFAKLPQFSKFIVTHRDPRDALISFMRFMVCDFERAFGAMIGFTKTCDHYRKLPAELSLHINYEDILDQPVKVIENIAHFLTLMPTKSTISEIHDKYRKENVGKIIRMTEESIKRRTANKEQIAKDEIANIRSKNSRAFDDTTGFQSRHISEYQDGDWQNILSNQQKTRIHKALGEWLEANNYTL